MSADAAVMSRRHAAADAPSPAIFALSLIYIRHSSLACRLHAISITISPPPDAIISFH
jgi:hypothetical protein